MIFLGILEEKHDSRAENSVLIGKHENAEAQLTHRAQSDACCENILESAGSRRMFSFLSLQEMNTNTKSKGYWAGLLQPVKKGGGITKVFSAERSSYLLTHNVAEQLSQSVQLIMMQIICLYMTSSCDGLVLNITLVSYGRKN